MILALYILGTTFSLVMTLVRLSQAQEQLARLRGESDQRAQDVRDAYAHGVAMSLACLLAAMAAASWYRAEK